MRHFILFTTLLFCSFSFFGQEKNTDTLKTDSNSTIEKLLFDYKYCFDKKDCINSIKNQVNKLIFNEIGDELLEVLPESSTDSVSTKILKLTYWVNSNGSIETALFGSNINSHPLQVLKLKEILSQIQYKPTEDNYMTKEDLDKQYFHYAHLKKDATNTEYSLYTPRPYKPNFVKDSMTPPTFKRCKLKKDVSQNLKDVFAAERKCLEGHISKIVGSNFNRKIIKKSFKKLKKEYQISKDKKVKTITTFKFNKKGEIADIKALSILREFENEAIRVVRKIPNVIPGSKKGKPVSVLYSLPITLTDY